MTKKDYIQIAKVLKSLPYDSFGREIQIQRFSTIFKIDNPRFNENLFRRAVNGK
jgi:hypothetical protein